MNSFDSHARLTVNGHDYEYFSLERAEAAGAGSLDRLPFSIKILIENLLRFEDDSTVTAEDIWRLTDTSSRDQDRGKEFAFRPTRVLLQDYTGIPAIVDMASMRYAIQQMGGDPERVNPICQTDLVIDHSVQVDQFGKSNAFRFNSDRQWARNHERFVFLKWAQNAFRNLKVVPPDVGIVHQVHLERIALVVAVEQEQARATVSPDTVIGADSHTTMINGIGVLGWGVGGIEAEAVMLGQPIAMLLPRVIGVKVRGRLRTGVTATDAVLTVTEMLRDKNVVGAFVEFFGPGVGSLGIADRATIANMAPEYGATIGFFPLDETALEGLRITGRDPGQIALIETYLKTQGLFRTDAIPDPIFDDTLQLDLSVVEPSLAGPRRPQDRVPLAQSKSMFRRALADTLEPGRDPNETVPVKFDGTEYSIGHGSVVLAAITSCTNTSNPSVMVGAGLLARNALQHGLKPKPWVKTSLAPGSRVVIKYLQTSGLLPHLEALGFALVGYGCTTCIGNSGPLIDPVARAVEDRSLFAAGVLSGNRNFEGRIHPLVRANYLASPPLVVAYALAGTMDVDLSSEPIGRDHTGAPVYLAEIWPKSEEIADIVSKHLNPSTFQNTYQESLGGDRRWQELDAPRGTLFEWADDSTYVRRLSFLDGMPRNAPQLEDIVGARALALLGDSVTTDHINPAGPIPSESPAGQYLQATGLSPEFFHSYGARRGNYEVMTRSTFAHPRLMNRMVPESEGGWTLHLPNRTEMTIYDAARAYQENGIATLVIAGEGYGMGSSRDWAAKGPALLGVRAVLAESFERIHRSNLIGMGILPLQFQRGESAEHLGLTGLELYDIEGIAESLEPGQFVTVRVRPEDAVSRTFRALVRLDARYEVEYYQHGGILPYVLRQMLSS